MSNSHARIATPDIDGDTTGLGQLGLGVHATGAIPVLAEGTNVFLRPNPEFVSQMSDLLGVTEEEVRNNLQTVSGQIVGVNDQGIYTVAAQNEEGDFAIGTATWDGNSQAQCATHEEPHPILITTL